MLIKCRNASVHFCECYTNFFACYLQTLYTYPENFRAYKILIAAQFSGATVKVAQNFVFGETNKSEAFLKKFPFGKVSELSLF